MLLEELRPRTLEQFIGNEDAIMAAQAYMDGRSGKPAALFYGNPGTGKTSLAHILAAIYNLVAVEINGSDQTQIKNLDQIVSQLTSLSLDGKQKLLIMDEAENASNDLLLELLDVRVKKILIVNAFEEMHWKVKSDCQHIYFQLPRPNEYQRFLDRLDIEAPADILNQFRSFRDICNWIDGGDAQSPLCHSELEEMKRLFDGDAPQKIQTPTWRILEYYLFNSGNPEIASQLDMMRHGQDKESLRIMKALKLSHVITPYKFWKRDKEKFKKKEIKIRVLGFK